MSRVLVVALAALCAGTVAEAAQGTDPDWPCIQRKVDRLSLAVMWPHPVPESGEELRPEFQAAAEQMALRRVSVDEVGGIVDDLAEAHPELGVEEYGRIFAEAFERIDRQRSQLIAGIARYARGQAQLAEGVNALRAEMAELEAAEEPDFDRMDAIEVELDWRERLFDDRNAALTYVCETPVLLERRAYAIAQELLRRVD